MDIGMKHLLVNSDKSREKLQQKAKEYEAKIRNATSSEALHFYQAARAGFRKVVEVSRSGGICYAQLQMYINNVTKRTLSPADQHRAMRLITDEVTRLMKKEEGQYRRARQKQIQSRTS